MRLITFCLLAACLTAAAQPVPAFRDPQRRVKLLAALPDVQKVFESFKAERKAPGLAYGMVLDGEIVLMRTSGVRETVGGSRVTEHTMFRIASMSKSFTALAILKLRDQGKLSLEDPVTKWIPEFSQVKLPTSDSAPIRLRQLLTHGAGFPEDNPWGDRQLGVPESDLSAWLRLGLPFSTPPDTAFEYSNYGFALLGRIVEKASGTPYDTYLEKEILAPLGLKNTTLHLNRVPKDRLAKGYREIDGAYREEPVLPHGAFGAMGGLFTDLHDLGRYVAYMLSAWPPRDDADRGPVRRSSLREMQQAWRPSGLSAGSAIVARGYGYGLSVSRNCRYAHVVGHGGGLPGYGSYMLWLPEYGVGFFAMANLRYAGPSAAMDRALEVLDKTGALQPREWPLTPALITAREAVWQLWQRGDGPALTSLAADNLLLDRDAAERKREVEKLRESVGACKAPGPVEPENWLRGRFRIPCENGAVDASFTLAPTMPPKLQHISYAKVDPQAKPPACPGGPSR